MNPDCDWHSAEATARTCDNDGSVVAAARAAFCHRAASPQRPSWANIQDIRIAATDDHDIVLACVRAAYAKYVSRLGKEPAPVLADYQRLISQGAVYVLQGPVGLCGVVVMMPDEQGMFLENIAVHPAFQGLGLGQQLMAFVERSAREQNLPLVHLYTNEAMTENLSLYEHLGFEEIGRRTEDGYRRVYFRKVLA